MKPIRLAVLGSTRGSNLIPLAKALEARGVAFQIEAVISNRSDAGILKRATENYWPAVYLPVDALDRNAYDSVLSACLQTMDVDLIVLMGYMRILSPAFVERWRHQVINVHPSLLPQFAGKMDRAVHQAVIDSGVSETGCTVHEVSEAVDQGAILIQKKCPVQAADTPETLKARVQALEVEALTEVIQRLEHPGIKTEESV